MIIDLKSYTLDIDAFNGVINAYTETNKIHYLVMNTDTALRLIKQTRSCLPNEEHEYLHKYHYRGYKVAINDNIEFGEVDIV